MVVELGGHRHRPLSPHPTRRGFRVGNIYLVSGGARSLHLTTPPPISGGGPASRTGPGHDPHTYPVQGGRERGGAAASRAAAGGPDTSGPHGAASEGATAPEEGAEDRGEAADLLGSLNPTYGEPARPGSQSFPPSGFNSRPPALSSLGFWSSGSQVPPSDPGSELPIPSFPRSRPLGPSLCVLSADGGGGGPAARRAGWGASGRSAGGGAAQGAAGAAGGHGAGRPRPTGAGLSALLGLHHWLPSFSREISGGAPGIRAPGLSLFPKWGYLSRDGGR